METGLEWIPRSVREKLDRVGLKIHLRDWQKLTLSERASLRDLPCGTPEEVERYRNTLRELLRNRCGTDPEPL
ncbi:MAG: hypothetical protein KatS3mg076_2453 [Candidatus Binatia bacterium]|nr:MAG: hypothetical protein KatS3mg076_2453 [Candidatus Binatia bacterium]